MGPECFRVRFPEVAGEDWVRRYGVERIPDRAHNRFLDVLVATGLAGLAADVALVVLVALAALRSRDPAGAAVRCGIAAGLAGYLAQSMFLFDTFDLSIVAWTLAGTLVAPAGLVAPAASRRGSRAGGGVASVSAAVVAWGAVAVVADHRAGGGADQLVRAAATRPRSLDYHLRLAAVAQRSGDADGLRLAHRTLAAWDDPDVRLSDADVLARLGVAGGDRDALTLAVARYGEVLARHPHNGLAWLGRGEARVRLGDTRDARTDFERARVLLPRSVYPSLDLALLALAEGDVTAARALAGEAAGIAPRHPAVEDLRARLRGL